MKTTKTPLSKKIKNKLQEKIQESKDLIHDRVQQIRRSYPFDSMEGLPGLSVSLLAGDPADNYSSKDMTFDKKTVIDDVSKLALL